MGKRNDRRQRVHGKKERVTVFFRAITSEGIALIVYAEALFVARGICIWKVAKKDIMIPLSADYKNRCGGEG